MNYNFKDLNLRMLIVHDAMCRLKNTIAAAHDVNISQPAVSRYMKQLKELTGQELFVRTNAGMEPTQAGLEIWEKSSIVLRACQQMVDVPNKQFDPNRESKEFRIATPLFNTSYLIETLVIDCLKRYPGIRIKMIFTDVSNAIEKIMHNEIDLFIGYRPKNRPKVIEDYKTADVDYEVLCSDKSPLYTVGGMEKTDFMEATHLKIYTSHTETMMDQKLKKLGIFPKTLFEVPDINSVELMLTNTDMLFIAMRTHAHKMCQKHKNLRILPTNFSIPSSSIHLLWHRQKSQEPAQLWLHDFVEERIAKNI